MELVLRHHAGYQWRFLVGMAIVVEGGLTFALFEELVTAAALRRPLTVLAMPGRLRESTPPGTSRQRTH
jgi:hypothetical protein